MPNGNHRGPQGEGPRSGRGMGFCSGAGQPGWMNDTPAQERGCRRRGGQGHRNRDQATGLTGGQRANAQPVAESHAEPVVAKNTGRTGDKLSLNQLQQEAGQLESALRQIRLRIDQLSAQSAAK
jgi:hypothetical protein